LPALSLDGILALEIIEGSFTKLTFTSFINGLLEHMNPFPKPNSVIVMDNCRIHKSELIQEMIREW
jgi:transposase